MYQVIWKEKDHGVMKVYKNFDLKTLDYKDVGRDGIQMFIILAFVPCSPKIFFSRYGGVDCRIRKAEDTCAPIGST